MQTASPKGLPESDALVLPHEPEEVVDELNSRMTYFLEVDIAKEVIHVLHSWNPDKSFSSFDKCKAVIYYAENDAYQLPKPD